AVRLRSPLSTMPARILSRRFPQRSPPWLLTTAACGGLRSAPDCRTRRALLHLSYSCAAPILLAMLVTHDPNPDIGSMHRMGRPKKRRYHQALWKHEANHGRHDCATRHPIALLGTLTNQSFACLSTPDFFSEIGDDLPALWSDDRASRVCL